MKSFPGTPALTLSEPLECAVCSPGTVKAFFRGNGTNVIKIAPETALKLTCNDRIKDMVVHDRDRITPMQRMVCGAVAGAIAQVRGALPPALTSTQGGHHRVFCCICLF